jgi:mannose-6-phosphate isomerase-like protein (cupin superfamily)
LQVQQEKIMIVRRWEAGAPLSPKHAEKVIMLEGMEPIAEIFDPKVKTQENRHPYFELRFVLAGQLLVNVSGNQVLLRQGDSILIPPNTRHSYTVVGESPCESLYGRKYS